MAWITFVTLLGFFAFGQSDSEELVVLTEENFEHLTQVATGATTGDWFVLFHKGEAECCKSLLSAWQALASKVSSSNDLQLSIARVDGLANPSLVKRFNQTLPSTVYFRLGKMYQVSVTPDADYLFDFVRESKYKSFPSKPVPKQLTFLSDFSLEKLLAFPFNIILLVSTLFLITLYYSLNKKPGMIKKLD